MDSFTSNGIFEKNLKPLWEEQIINRNKDLTVLIVGAPGTSKSSLTMYLALWAAENLDGVTFDFSHIAYDHDPWLDNEQEKLPERAFSWYDEGRNTFNRRRAMHNENKEGLDHLNMYRYRNIFRAINFQNMYDMEPGIVFENAHVVLRTVKQGWAHVYSQNGIQRLKFDSDTKTVKWPEPAMRISFADPAKRIPEKWEAYERAREDKMNKRRNSKKKDDKRTVTCDQCGHSWVPRVDVPQRCPECRSRHWNKRVGG